jgi:glucose/arabinose dehydrogenase
MLIPILLFLFSCSTKADESYGWDTSVEKTDKESFIVENFIDGFEIPWGMCFLPNKDLLVSDRNGTLWQIKKDGKSKKKISGVPKVKYKGQGGLLDVQIHPNFIDNNLVYICFSDFLPKDKNKSFTSIVRAELKNNKLLNVQTIYKADDKFYTKSNVHYGSRLVFDNNNYLYFSIGDRGNRNQAQLLTTPNGKIHRLNDDGSIPEDNPFVNKPDAQKSIWTYGNRNPQGLVIDKKTYSIFSAEHGPRGGDELNVIEKGKNYGWPEITYGINYIGTKITKYTHKEGMEQPITHWTPSIAVCGIDFYDNKIFTNWQNNLFVTSLKFENLYRLEIENRKVVKQELILNTGSRVRDVETGPDGFIYVAIEDPGRVIRLKPIKN